jgi:hypothetical protein
MGAAGTGDVGAPWDLGPPLVPQVSCQAASAPSLSIGSFSSSLSAQTLTSALEIVLGTA